MKPWQPLIWGQIALTGLPAQGWLYAWVVYLCRVSARRLRLWLLQTLLPSGRSVSHQGHPRRGTAVEVTRFARARLCQRLEAFWGDHGLVEVRFRVRL